VKNCTIFNETIHTSFFVNAKKNCWLLDMREFDNMSTCIRVFYESESKMEKYMTLKSMKINS